MSDNPESQTPTLVDSMGRDLFVGDVVHIPNIPVKWKLDQLELTTDGQHVRLTAHADLQNVFPADKAVPNITRVATEAELTELNEELRKAALRAAPSIVRPH